MRANMYVYLKGAIDYSYLTKDSSCTKLRSDSTFISLEFGKYSFPAGKLNQVELKSLPFSAVYLNLIRAFSNRTNIVESLARFARAFVATYHAY